MKKILFSIVAACAFTISSDAQAISLGARYSLLTGHGANDNHSSLSGATIFGNYAITDNMSVGAVIHAYGPRKNAYKSGDFAYTATDAVTNIAVSYEMAFSSKTATVQPYAGIDLGMSSSSHKVEYYTDARKLKKLPLKQVYAMISPKVGMRVAVSKNFGFYTEAQYNFSAGDGGRTVIEVKNLKYSTSFTTEPISKYYNIDTGIYMLLGNIRKILAD